MEFLPFTFESTGKIHPKSLIFLQKIAKRTEMNKGRPSGSIYNYWLKHFSITLQRSIADSIIQRSHLINGRLFSDPNQNFIDILHIPRSRFVD